jgi:hypothetical protein
MRAVKRCVLVLGALWVAAALLLGAGGLGVAAGREHKSGHRRMLQLGFRRAGQASVVMTTGRFSFIAAPYADAAGTVSGRLIDEQTGRRRTVSLPGCSVPAGGELQLVAGDPWLLFSCGNQSQPYELYSMVTGAWQPFTPAASVEAFCRAPGMGSCAPVAVGAHWSQLEEGCYHCVTRMVFQNIRTGALRSDPRNATTIVDLTSVSLAKPVCRPLRVPASGGFVFDGRFALAEGSRAFLERCGTRLHRRIGAVGMYPASSEAVVWTPAPTRSDPIVRAIDGLCLPNLRRFSAFVPRQTGYPYEIVLSDRHLYELTSTNELWVAPAPGCQE